MTVAGLRVVLVTFAGFVLVVLGIALAFGRQLDPLEPAMHEPLLTMLGALALAEVLALYFVRRRSRKAWLEQLATQPYQPGGPLPPAYSSAVLIGAALCQGLGHFGAVVFALTHRTGALAFGVLSILFILMQFPKDAHLVQEPR